MKKIDKEILNTAYHEAGHAAAFIFLDLKFKTITIEPDEDTVGKVIGRTLSRVALNSLEYATPFINKDRVEKSLIISIAGPVAEAKFRGRFDHVKASGDYYKINEFLVRIFEDYELSNAYYKYIVLLANRIIERQEIWNYIARLAAVLADKHTLSYEECLQFYSETNLRFMESQREIMEL